MRESTSALARVRLREALNLALLRIDSELVKDANIIEDAELSARSLRLTARRAGDTVAVSETVV